MSAPNAVDESAMRSDSWAPQDGQPVGPGGNPQATNGQSLPVDDRGAVQSPENPDFPRGSSVTDNETFREKQVKAAYRLELPPILALFSCSLEAILLCAPNTSFDSIYLDWCLPSAAQPNKVYIGGLPEHTRHEDLQNCFGKIGNIINIELKVGYGFVEFDTREAAEESVAKYHEGYFMGNKIRVELSHGGGRTAKFAGDPGACFKCGQMGHWARLVTPPIQGCFVLIGWPGNAPITPARWTRCFRGHRRPNYDPPLIDRIQRDYGHSRNLPPRDDFPPRVPPRDSRYDYPPPPGRDYRRPPSPREYRDYPPPPGSRVREYDDFRRGPPPLDDRDRFPPPPPSDFRGRFPPGQDTAYRGYGPPPPQVYDRYDRRPADRYTPYSQPPGQRPRSPPRVRDDYDRAPPRDYPEYRGRPASPPRYPPDYGRVGATSPPSRYRRRSASPPARSGPPYDGYPINGYIPGPVAPGPSPAAAPRGVRDYPRNNRDIVEPVGVGPYRRP
ncbi:hypothetical protein CVT26_002711 [Gymnopilus dilepis]|uniref:RRM domain-containing protein n=1 Tax=Gymnopilus dilepis TaxID=231916 RepID=A0A409VEZ4_9AGAR|nr:hypothetical protein CVT26_002711 [Gymnopilus dilepis]